MAKVWNQILKEESEHQWLAIAGFFVFVILGAILIKGTDFIPGIDIVDNSIDENGIILDASYISDDESYSLLLSDGQKELIWNNNGILQAVTDSQSNFNSDDIDFLTHLSNDTILVSQGENGLVLVSSGITSPFQTNHGVDQFSIIDISEGIRDDSGNFMMVTNENGSSTGIRGLNQTGITSSNIPTTDNVQWKQIISLGDNKWLASGIYFTPTSSGSESPATPTIKPVYATIIWNGGFTAPMVNDLYIGSIGEYHTMISFSHEEVIIAGTHETILMNHVDGETQVIDYASVAAISDDCKSAWLFNGKDSKSVLRFKDSEHELMKLPHSLPLDLNSAGFDGETIYLHGIDESGDSRVMTFDTTAVGSIESGRGFINFSFIVISIIILAVMAVNIYDRFQEN